MTRREWTVDDRFGRTWRLALEAGGTDETNQARDVLDTLAHVSLARPPDRSDHVAEALFAVAAAIGRERDAYDDWLRLPLDDAWRLADAVTAEVVRAATAGILRVDPVVRAFRFHYDKEEIAPPSVQELVPEVESDAWIAIELVDQDGNPVPDVAYLIECPDGHVRRGTTDASGMAREAGLDHGNCKVSFPDLHGPDWKKVG